jgi:Putative DNA-binding domain
MLTDDAIDALRFKSEGTDLDFKRAQYRLSRAEEAEKAELLKDILAMANAWRDGPAHILIGFAERKPLPADVVGISDQLDDAQLQQFVNSKVKPKLEFRYEERMYEGKQIGVITVPKQPRPFYLTKQYGSLKSNVVYVRRGSSTDEAEPPEVAKMANFDAGRGTASVEVSVRDSRGDEMPSVVDVTFLRFSEMPDYASRRRSDSMGLAAISMWTDNSRFYRQAAAYLAKHYAVVDASFEIANRSGFSLTGAKLEIFVVAIDDQSIELMIGDDFPEEPVTGWSQFDHLNHISNLAPRVGTRMSLVKRVRGLEIHAQFDTLLPGETTKSDDWLAVLPSSQGKLRFAIRLLANELEQPMEFSHDVEVTGSVEAHNVEGLKGIWLRYSEERDERGEE